MGRLVTHARQLRLEYQAKVGRHVPIEEVATQIGIDRKTLTKIELSQLRRIDADTIERLCAFYAAAGLNVKHILEYQAEGIRTPGLATA